MAIDTNHIVLMFNDIAPTYDKLNHLLSLNVDKSWRRKAVRRLKKSLAHNTNPKILDVACGTADSTVQIAKTIANAEVIGIDISDKMLEIGQEKVKKSALDEKIRFVKSFAEDIDFQDNTFNAVFVAFGVRNFADRLRGLSEMVRVVKPNGDIMILELSEPQNVIMRWVYNLYFKNILPLIGKRVSGNGDAYRYLQQSVERFPLPQEFVKMLEAVGCQEVTHKALSCGLCRLYHAKKA